LQAQRIEIEPSGKIVVVVGGKSTKAATEPERNEWDAVG
jgi:hypothetical protein